MSNATAAAIRLNGVSRTYIEGQLRHVVLQGVDLEVAEGEVVAIRGRSGSGKSTLLNLIGGIDVADDGTIVVAGRELTALSERDRTLFRRRNVGFVYQAFNLVPTLNVADNIRLVLELNGVQGDEASKRIRELLEAVELDTRSDSYPDLLSGGEQQRVAIARAVCHRPAVLLADEPTGNLDEKTSERVLGLLDEIVRQHGGTMLIATHSQRIAESCDRTVMLCNGRLEAPA